MSILPLLLLPLPTTQDWVPVSDLPSDGPSYTVRLGGRLLAATTSGPLVSDDSGTNWKLSITGFGQASLTLRSNTVWCLRNSKWLYSADHGSSWDGLALSASGLWRLFAVGNGFLTRRNDTSLYFDSRTGSYHPLPMTASEYLFNARSLGGKLVAEAESGQFLSVDSGTTWTPYRTQPNNSVPYSVLRTANQWLVLTDGGVSASGDLRSWSMESGNGDLRHLRNIGGRIHGLGWNLLLRRTPSGWLKDTVGKAPASNDNHHWIARDSAVRWLTDGAELCPELVALVAGGSPQVSRSTSPPAIILPPPNSVSVICETCGSPSTGNSWTDDAYFRRRDSDGREQFSQSSHISVHRGSNRRSCGCQEPRFTPSKV